MALNTGAAMALASAALFGASTPMAKLFLSGGADPGLLAGLLYFGSGCGLAVLGICRKMIGLPTTEEPLRRRDAVWLGLVIVTGGIAGPFLLMIGLAHSPASSASLLLNVEGLATMVIAWVIFRENVDRALLIGAASILAGATLLSWPGGVGRPDWGAVAIIGACIAWAADNNLTRRLSAADPVQLAMIKGLAAGTVNLALAFSAGSHLPAPRLIALAGLTGFIGYGLSLVLFILALRHLGAARAGAYFSSAPFIGALLAILIFREPVTLQLLAAGVLMAVGLYLHLAERHEHGHTHVPLDHAHRHTHDRHHQHTHSPRDALDEPHSHWHHHPAMRHRHPHYPDLHHRHRHRHATFREIDL